jgi:hypothetical protein
VQQKYPGSHDAHSCISAVRDGGAATHALAALAVDTVVYFVAVNLILRATGDDLLVLAGDVEAPLFTLAWAVAYELGFLLLWSATPESG